MFAFSLLHVPSELKRVVSGQMQAVTEHIRQMQAVTECLHVVSQHIRQMQAVNSATGFETIFLILAYIFKAKKLRRLKFSVPTP
jgi:hypothetical protein